MKQNILKWNFALFILVIILVSFVFYWFQIRPAEIRKSCKTNAIKKYSSYNSNSVKVQRIRNNYYRGCLVGKGMKAESLYVNLQ